MTTKSTPTPTNSEKDAVVVKRGRPKGSPNKPKYKPKGRPKGSKNKPGSKAGRKKGSKNKVKGIAPYPKDPNNPSNHDWEIRSKAEAIAVMGIDSNIDVKIKSLFNEELFNEKRMDPKKKLISLNLLITNYGNKSKVSFILGMSYRNFKYIEEEDNYFAECVAEVPEIILDIVEENVKRMAVNKDLKAAQYLLDRLGRSRGYGKVVENINTNLDPIIINIDEKMKDKFIDINIIED